MDAKQRFTKSWRFSKSKSGVRNLCWQQTLLLVNPVENFLQDYFKLLYWEVADLINYLLRTLRHILFAFFLQFTTILPILFLKMAPCFLLLCFYNVLALSAMAYWLWKHKTVSLQKCPIEVQHLTQPRHSLLSQMPVMCRFFCPLFLNIHLCFVRHISKHHLSLFARVPQNCRWA